MATQQETKSIIQQAQPEKTPKAELMRQLLEMKDEDVIKIFDIISKMFRAFAGKDVMPADQITRLIDVKNILERSYFPVRPEVDFQVYLRLLAKFYPKECGDCELWADIRAQALKSLEGFSSQLYVEMFKAQNLGALPTSATNISLGQFPKPTEKRHWYQRKQPQQKEAPEQ